MRELPAQREATARERELLERPLEEAMRVDVVDRRAGRDVRRASTAENIGM